MTTSCSGLGIDPIRLLMRHADAGDRHAWAGPDGWRPLSDRGRTQALDVVDRLAGLPVLRVLSSPSLRCRQTVAPVAGELSLEIETCRLLRVDAEPVALARYLLRPDTRGALLCTHRETLLGLFGWYAAAGPRYIDGIVHMETAAAWVLHGGEDSLLRVRYLRTDVHHAGLPPAPCGPRRAGKAKP